jgi:transcriptional regulator
VPTWSYAAVHVYGRPRVIDDGVRVRDVLERLVARYEASRPQPWSAAELPPEYVERMVGAIVCFELPVDRIEAKFKLGQNRARQDVEGVIEALADEGGTDGRALAQLMRAALDSSR